MLWTNQSKLGLHERKITMVGLASGLVLGIKIYRCWEDVGVLRSIPNLTIISPSDSLETVKAIEASLTHEQSCYIRITGGSNNPIVNEDDFDFKIGKGKLILKGEEILIIATGSSVSHAIKASLELKKKNLNSSVINMSTIKPLDQEIIKNNLDEKVKLIVTVEEHNIIGGLGSAVSEYLAEMNSHPPLMKIGVNDKYSYQGGYEYLLKSYGLFYSEIVNKISKFLR